MFLSLLLQRLKMGAEKFLLLSIITLSFHSLSFHSNSEGHLVHGHHTPVSSSHRVFNVDHYGAKGDGTDDSQAFGEAWKEACSSASAFVLVPRNKKYLLKPVVFSGPCKAQVTFLIRGTIEASSDRSDWDGHGANYWILFDNIRNLVVRGGGTLDGNGKVWWQNSCKRNPSLPCVDAPTALYFSSCKNLVLENLKVKDSQQMHVAFRECSNVRASKLTITAPETSPNTDGIHVSGTQKILIKDCIIGTGDDCISIVSGSRRVTATNIVCGPGHGISIGSLGANHSSAHVSNVLVDKAMLKGTTNGVRIKTWQGGQGYAKNIIFQNVVMQDVQNPIIIDQNYCDSRNPCHEQKSAVEVSHVLYKNIRGTSASKSAMKFDCSSSIPCSHIVLQNIDLVGEGRDHPTSSCKYLCWTQIGKVVPACA